jgi:hypothetical protein
MCERGVLDKLDGQVFGSFNGVTWYFSNFENLVAPYPGEGAVDRVRLPQSAVEVAEWFLGFAAFLDDLLTTFCVSVSEGYVSVAMVPSC